VAAGRVGDRVRADQLEAGLAEGGEVPAGVRVDQAALAGEPVHDGDDPFVARPLRGVE
jgi:hypothetical protein